MRVALPKGHLRDGVLGLLERAGITFTFKNDRDYRPACSDGSVTAKMFKVRSIPQLLDLGQYDIGFCGKDLVAESGYELIESVLDLELNPVELVVAVRRGNEDIFTNPPRRPLLIATEYVRLADDWALQKNLAHITVQSYGSTEAFAPEDADIVFDNCETGRTIEANGLVIVERLMRSTTHMVASKFALENATLAARIQELKKKLEQARRPSNG